MVVLSAKAIPAIRVPVAWLAKLYVSTEVTHKLQLELSKRKSEQ